MVGPSLKISDLVVTAPRSRNVILKIDHLELSAGQCLGIRGPSGAGKSTLLYGLAGLLPYVTGRIQWDETDVVALSNSAKAAFRRNNVGLVFQDFLLFEELSAKANATLAMAYSPRKKVQSIRSEAARILTRFGVADHSRTVESFSGGERQRVAVARALAPKPKIILADEPTASLDRQTADLLIDDMMSLVRETGLTMVAVSHDPAVYDRMDRVIDIVDGQLVGNGENDV